MEKINLSDVNSKTRLLIDWWNLTYPNDPIKYSESKSWAHLSGIGCPGAKDCKAWVEIVEGKRKLVRGKGCKFSCFSANDEVQYSPTYEQRLFNRELMLTCKTAKQFAKLILDSIPEKIRIFRPNIGGDVLTRAHMEGIICAAELRPNTHFYFYTKSIHFLHKMGYEASDLPKNLRIVMSIGGKFDGLIPEMECRGFNYAKVVYSKAEAKKLNLEIDVNDSLCAFGKKNFALLIHGNQKPGSKAAMAVNKIRKDSRK